MITDELREYTKRYSVAGSKKDTMLSAIADRIDIAHKHAIGYVDDRDPETMAENGWVRLPVDANGECIRVGDKMDGYGKTIEVVELRIGRSGWVIVGRDGNANDDTFAFTHHKPTTVEDVLEEMYDALEDARIPYGSEKRTYEEIIAEYAAKLQLKEDA